MRTIALRELAFPSRGWTSARRGDRRRGRGRAGSAAGTIAGPATRRRAVPHRDRAPAAADGAVVRAPGDSRRGGADDPLAGDVAERAGVERDRRHGRRPDRRRLAARRQPHLSARLLGVRDRVVASDAGQRRRPGVLEPVADRPGLRVRGAVEGDAVPGLPRRTVLSRHAAHRPALRRCRAADRRPVVASSSQPIARPCSCCPAGAELLEPPAIDRAGAVSPARDGGDLGHHCAGGAVALAMLLPASTVGPVSGTSRCSCSAGPPICSRRSPGSAGSCWRWASGSSTRRRSA